MSVQTTFSSLCPQPLSTALLLQIQVLLLLFAASVIHSACIEYITCIKC